MMLRCVERRDTELLSPLFQLVRRGEEEESEVERIQELFPHDDLRLHERDPVTQVSSSPPYPFLRCAGDTVAR